MLTFWSSSMCHILDISICQYEYILAHLDIRMISILTIPESGNPLYHYPPCMFVPEDLTTIFLCEVELLFAVEILPQFELLVHFLWEDDLTDPLGEEVDYPLGEEDGFEVCW